MFIGNGLDLGNQRVLRVGDPVAPTDGANKQYVDASIRGLDWKQSVKAGSVGNLTLSGTQTVDGIALIANDRVLVKNQTDSTQNGIYVVAAGAWSRSADFSDGTNTSSAAAVTIEQGSTQADQVWMLTTDGTITVGTTSLAFSQLGGGQSATPGNGITIVGTAVSVKAATNGGILVAAGGVSVDRSIVPNTWKGAVPAGSTSTLLHNLGTTDVQVSVYDISGAKPVLILADVTITDSNTVTLTWGTAATAGQYRAIVIG